MNETLEQFLERRHLRALREFERLNTYKWDDLVLGTKLYMLRNGFGGYGGQHRVVSEIKDDHKLVKDVFNPKDLHSYCIFENCAKSMYAPEDKEHWTEFCYILTPEDLAYQKHARWRDFDDYMYLKTGYRF